MPIHQISHGINKNLCFIVLSVSGEQEDILNFIENDAISSCKVISITNGTTSTLSKISNLNLPYYVPLEMYGEMNISSQIPAMSILETLARKAYYLKEHEKK